MQAQGTAAELGLAPGVTAQQIAERVYLVGGRAGGRFPCTYSLLIVDQTTALIDAGCGREALTSIERALHPELVLISHAHPDHCSGAGLFPAERRIGPAESLDFAGDLERMSRRFVAAELRAEWIAFMREEVDFVEFEPGASYRDGQRWELGHTVIEAVHAPGHTPDHYCFYLPNEQLLLTTDIDFTSFGPWYGNPDSEINGFIAAIERVRRLPLEAVVSSHKGVLRDQIQQRFDRYLEHFSSRDRRILDFLETPRSIDDFVEAALIYGRYPYRPGILRYWEAEMIASHLRRLGGRGLVVEEQGRFSRVNGEASTGRATGSRSGT